MDYIERDGVELLYSIVLVIVYKICIHDDYILVLMRGTRDFLKSYMIYRAVPLSICLFVKFPLNKPKSLYSL